MKKIVLFSTDTNFKSDRIFEFIVLFAKHFIYRCRYDKALPRLCVFTKELKRRYEIEKYNNKLDTTLPDSFIHHSFIGE